MNARAAILLVASAACLLASPAEAKINTTPWGQTPDGRTADLYTLTNARGMVARISNFGGVLVGLDTPDRAGKLADVVRGFDTLDDYANPAKDPHYYGAIVGRYANTLDGAQFALDGKTYKLAANSGTNTLHGGPVGLNRRLWAAATRDGASPRLTLTYTDPDGANGFPGALSLTVSYTLTAENTLRIDYRATTDKPTVINLTNHSYFNLKGHDAGPVLDHAIQIFADRVSARDGKIDTVAGTVLDFTSPAKIGAHIYDADPRLARGGGYNQNYILRGKPGALRLAARVTEPETGRVLEVRTTQPGMMFYTANLATPVIGKGGVSYIAHTAFCLETQHYPNSANVPAFPSTTLRPGQTFHEITEFRFSAR
jgi:aldose 1-epimerase